MPAFPSGTVTFLFTDIEGSTARWERDRTAMVAVTEQGNRTPDNPGRPRRSIPENAVLSRMAHCRQ